MQKFTSRAGKENCPPPRPDGKTGARNEAQRNRSSGLLRFVQTEAVPSELLENLNSGQLKNRVQVLVVPARFTSLLVKESHSFKPV